MVNYQLFMSIAFDVAREKGAQFEGQRSEDAQALMRLVSDLWNEDKARIKGMQKAQARGLLEDEIEVV